MDYQIRNFILDADTLVYSAGFIAEKKLLDDPDFSPESARVVLSNMVLNIFTNLGRCLKQDLAPRALAKSGQLRMFLTANDGLNFRYKVATLKPYKANRADKPRPFYYNDFRDFLTETYRAKVVSGYEADDAIGIRVADLRAPQNTIVIAQDKDMRQLPCWHYWYSSTDNYPKKPFYVEPTGNLQLERSNAGQLEVYATGNHQIAYQMLAGDTSDNIPSISRGWGPMKCYEYLRTCPRSVCPIDYAFEAYEKEYGEKEGAKRADEVYNLVKLLDKEPENATED